MRLLLALLITVLTMPAMAQETAAPAATANTTLKIERATTMATPGALPTAGIFMLITNNGTADDKLIDVKSDLAETTGIHSMDVDDKGVMRMRPLNGGLPIPAGKMTVLPPMGDHVMLIGIQNNKIFQENETFPLTLVFEKAGEVQVDVTAVAPNEFMKRFPAEMVGSARLKADEIRAKLDKNDNKKTWTQRLRDRIRALGGQSAQAPAPLSPAPAQAPVISTPAAPAPSAPPAVPDTSSAPTLTNDMSEEEAAKAMQDHSHMDHAQ